MQDVSWQTLSDPAQETRRERGETFKIRRACTIKDINVWDTCLAPIYVTVIKKESGEKWETKEVKYFVLCSTKDYKTPFQVRQDYRLRSRVEEGYRQVKNVWNIAHFSSPNRSLCEAHIAFVLLTYSLLTLYLRQTKQDSFITKFVTTLRNEMQANNDSNAVVAYAENNFALFGIKEYLELICNLSQEEKDRFTQSLGAVNQR